jgi:branched-chain amino acid aminotransferase
MMDFVVTKHTSPTSADLRQKLLVDLGFGRVYTDHMVTMRWTTEEGWHDARVTARAPFTIEPTSHVLRYAQEIFEGMKAYRTDSGAIALFRPELNAARFARSAERLAMPVLPSPVFLEALEHLVRIDRDWVPEGEGSLYLNPFMFATEPFLRAKPSSSYLFCVIGLPTGSYFKDGGKPLRVWVSELYTRAALGGTGAAKCGGNYAASFVAQAEATRHGCDQAVFLDAAERRWVEELTGANIFFVMNNGTLITPPLDGTILPGVTRATIIELASAAGMPVEQSRYAFEQWRSDAGSGRLREVFACGTSASVTSIGEVVSVGGSFRVADGTAGPVTTRLKKALVDAQRGRLSEWLQWLRFVE